MVEKAQRLSVSGRRAEMIKCYLCPLKDVCSVPKIATSSPALSIVLNWLPDKSEDMCPLYRTAKKYGKEIR